MSKHDDEGYDDLLGDNDRRAANGGPRQDDEETCLEAAVRYASDGWEVFPSPPGTKKSHKAAKNSGGINWGKTTDPAQIKKDWKKWSGANVCIATGPVSGFFVVEVDTPKGHDVDGIAALAELEAANSILPKTLMAESPSGSVHRYFRWPAAGTIINSTSKIGPGIDVRGDGGMVVAPPSIKPDVGKYKWLNDLPIAEAPLWLINLVLKKDKNKTAGGSGQQANMVLIAAALAVIPNDNLNWDEWNKIGMATFAATDGHEDGFKPFDRWSQLSDKYDADAVRERWYEGYVTSPPTEIGAGTLFHLADEAQPGWRPDNDQHAFIKGSNNCPINSQGNIRLALKKLGVTVRHNVFDDRSTIEGLENFDHLDDPAMDRLWLIIDSRFRFRPPRDFFWIVVFDEARRNSFHPVCQYLDGLKWDGIKRIDNWLTVYAGVKETPYTRAVGSLTLIAGVRRVRKPGCKFDEMPILLSDQGFNKSSGLAELAVRPEWFSDDLPLNADSKTTIERLRGRWIVEAAELKGMRTGDIEHLKNFLSRRVDRARMSYDRASSELLRQCVIIGTTNHEKFLRDQTGNRRYWPVRDVKFNIEKLKQDRDQLWAEAAAREAEGASIRLDPELWKDAAGEQAEHTVEEPWVEMISKSLSGIVGKLLSIDVWLLVGMADAQRNQNHNERLGAAMRSCGWERKKLRFSDPKGVHWGYVPKGKKAHGLKRIKVFYDWHQREVTVSLWGAEDPPIQDPRAADPGSSGRNRRANGGRNGI